MLVLISTIIFVSISLYVIHIKKNKSVFYLPVILVMVEIASIVLSEINLDQGFNGMIFLILFTFFVLNFKAELGYKEIIIYIFLLLLIVILSLNVSSDLNLVNRATRVGNFIFVLLLIPLAILNSYEVSRRELAKILFTAAVIYTTYIILASLVKFGPNHYNTGLIYGFRFEQWYFGALLVAVFPAYILYDNAKLKYYVISILLLLLILLVLRRTTWVIIIATSLLTILLTPSLRFNKKIIVSLILLIIPISLLFYTSNLWEQRGGRALTSTIENVEDEGRFLEYYNTYIILQESNSFLFGTDYLFDERGRYGHPREVRPMHGVYSRILFGAGFIGLFVYISVLLLTVFFLMKNRNKDDLFLNVVLASMITYLMVAFTGGSGMGIGISYVGTLFILSGYFIRRNGLQKVDLTKLDFKRIDI